MSPRKPLASLPGNPRFYEPAEVKELYANRYRYVLTFLGFGELGYNDVDHFARIVEQELDRVRQDEYVVNTATLVTEGFEPGTADVYAIAHRMNFRTAGLFPRIALNSPEQYSLSAFVEDIYFVNDTTWGGYLPGTELPSKMLTALTAVTDEAVVIGGGRHTAQEMREMLKLGKPIRYHTLEMNRDVASRWYAQQSQPVPDPRGEAFRFWSAQN
jgi:hypothetical protein